MSFNNLIVLPRQTFLDIEALGGEVSFAYNQIEFVEDFVFSGIDVTKVDLSVNRRLSRLDKNVFSGCLKLLIFCFFENCNSNQHFLCGVFVDVLGNPLLITMANDTLSSLRMQQDGIKLFVSKLAPLADTRIN